MASKEQGRSQHLPERRSGGDRRRERIELAAYYNAERRGFQKGNELDDWLAAERYIDSLSSGNARAEDQDAVQEQVRDDLVAAGESATPEDEPAGAEPRPDFPDAKAAGVQAIEPDEVKHWAGSLGVSAARLRQAIQRVGPVVDDVRRFLEAPGHETPAAQAARPERRKAPRAKKANS